MSADVTAVDGTQDRKPRLSVLVAALVGVLALAAALAAGHLVAAFVGLNSSPYLAVGNSAIDLTPTWLKDYAVRTFGVYDKLVLLGSMAVVMLVLAAVAGLVSRRSVVPGTVIIALFGLVGLVAVFNRPALGQLSLLAPVASLGTGVLVFRWLHRIAPRSAVAEHENTETDPDVETASADPNRRRFLVGAGGVAVGAGVVGLGGQLVSSARDAGASRAAIGELAVAEPAPPVPADADFAKLGTPSFITPNNSFYRVDTALIVPQVRAEDWSLRIHGMVDREVTFTFDDIRGRPLIERTITMTCVSNEVGGPYISTANFIGVDLRDLLLEAGVRDGAEQLFSTSEDGWTCGTPVEAALDPDRGAMLAIGMNGEPLPLEHGFPARMVVPGLYGYVSATKWVRDLEITTWDARNAYWLDRGWGERGPIKTMSRIDSPKGFANLGAGRVVVAGIAWAQPTGIEKVEVRLDDGPWQEAELSTVVNDDTWRMWQIELDVPPGSHKATARATDRSGYTQTEERVPAVPDGATGWHSVLFNTA
ncbi:DMSO/TMAO reductase YedYZ, molybdopterin-dependent catalytic subunit [Amycolatopsis marina]|uniref:DMSO/TMAO reductase YedYZ, molybdopterin-dependent catalytic subunit n=1 Tax=Amycolatopsis marina TaxID=490629 RepID=A0A1I0XFG0_9PSEU|nr:molybdopterin-dependent oxidoreductase [Amycolatopsis marina]SFA99427.1 DMSO/TMAO reductase YedYZ, molybdopterin-dependent catalytic subunit [Amycolatopsis marina]